MSKAGLGDCLRHSRFFEVFSGKIRKATAGKPCSCPDGKLCVGCKRKKALKPQVYIEEPHRLAIPIVVSHYRAKPTAVQVANKSRRWSFRKEESVKKPVVRTTLCQWYKRQKALNKLKRDAKREKQERKEQARRELEIEYLEHLRLQAEYAPVVKETTVVKKKKEEKEKKPVVKKQKPKRVKARTATAKPQADSKFVTVKQYNRYDALSNRFVNCCYRACCQFYCYISCILIIGFVIIYFL